MKGLASAALALAVAVPAAAQRGGGHASFSGHGASVAQAAPAFRGSFAPHPAYGYNATPLLHAPVTYPSRLRTLSPPVRYPAAPPSHRPVFYQPDHDRRLHTGHRFIDRSYPYFGYGFYPSAVYVGDWFGGFDDYDTPQQPAPEASYNTPDAGYAYPPQPPDYSYPYPQPTPESAQPVPSKPEMQYVPGSAETVTLVYKDGRPPEQIQNYLATRTTLTILDNSRRREIPLADLDIPATIKANRETGVDFQLPTATP